MPIEIARAAAPETRPKAWRRLGEIRIGGGIGAKERMFFTERLALLLETGNPLHTSLGTIESQTAHPELRQLIADVRENVSGGLPFSQALSKHPDAFPPAYVNLVAAGETGGFLHRVLQRLRDIDEKRQELRSTLISAFSYPAFLVVFSFAVVLFVLIVVFPKFGDLFQLIWDQLPITTRFLMVLGEWLRQYWLPGLVVFAVTGALGWRWVRSADGAAAADRWLLRIPVLREIAWQLHLIQFMYVMSLSLHNGVAMLDALSACREIVRSASFRRFVGLLESRVNEGRGIASGFQEAAFVPPLVKQMVATGEEAGGLAMVMERMAEFYEREWKQRLTVIAKIVEPAMLLVMGVVVGLIVSSLILPIFKLSRAVH